MRIVQVIDSLEVGGAEKMAVNYANALSERIDFSGLIATRAEGNLKKQLNGKVSYLFLNRKGTIDFSAALRLKKYCKKNKIDYLQPHSSSYFIVLLVKLIYPNIKIVWHDHNGLSEFISAQKSLILKIASYFFKGIIVVNFKLKNWAEKELNCKNVIYLPNFTSQNFEVQSETILKGVDGKRILCLANLRDQKNHFLLLEVAEKLKKTKPDWTFHLVGKDFVDDYSTNIKKLIVSNRLDDTVFVYGSKNDVNNIINQADIAILTSKSEGLPVALIEYGLMSKPVITTNVGEIPFIIQDGINGFIVAVNEAERFYERILELIDDSALRLNFGNLLHQTILENHSEEGVIIKYLNWIETL
ncbi:glycosyltransferase [Flavobacterium sp.]|jgi:glycosyltransferase involved in cell wall biosynthesis|uniref:glycosyltransferase n=1 Tax=Flavobacterium sp. TaxID=239 RepID=UPI0037BFDE29